jgi:hypothetical protein
MSLRGAEGDAAISQNQVKRGYFLPIKIASSALGGIAMT